MRSVPNKSASSTGTNRYQQPKHRPYIADEKPTKYEWFSNGIDNTAKPAPITLKKRNFFQTKTIDFYFTCWEKKHWFDIYHTINAFLRSKICKSDKYPKPRRPTKSNAALTATNRPASFFVKPFFQIDEKKLNKIHNFNWNAIKLNEKPILTCL